MKKKHFLDKWQAERKKYIEITQFYFNNGARRQFE